MKINLKKDKKELFFIAAGTIILVALVVFFIYSINFIAGTLNAALSADSAKPTPVIRFNIDGLKKLGIMK